MSGKYSVLSCAGFGSSGSGVVTDYLSEFDNINNFGDFEFRFLQDYGGVTTLEDCLVHSYHRQNSDIAIQNFINYINWQSGGDIFNKRYERFFHGQFRRISYDFLNKLIEVKWKGFWGEYLVITPRLLSQLKYKLYPHLLRLLNGNRRYIARYYPRKQMYFSQPTYEYFIKCVREYMNDLCYALDPEHQYKYIYFDQLLPPTNIKRYFNYFDSLKVIVVDRDPRDYYIENVIKLGEGWIPPKVDDFIKHYRALRRSVDTEVDNPNVLRIRFEDTIYHYNEFSEKINSFLDLSEEQHIYLQQKFNPQRSVHNTQLWKTIKVAPKVIQKITDELNVFCYPF